MREDISSMTDEEVVDTYMKTIHQFMEEFSDKLQNKIRCRYIVDRDTIELDYYALRQTYSKNDTKLALSIFKKYVDILTMYTDILKFKYKDIEYYTGKTMTSSAVIGKNLYISNFPYKLPDESEDMK